MDEPSGSGPPTTTITNSEDDEDTILAKSKVLTRKEVLKRRARRLTRLAKCYREHYWSLMEEVRRKHREFYWKYGKSPYIEHNGIVGETEYDIVRNGVLEDSNGDNVDGCNKFGLKFGESFKLCVFSGCKAKAMALTSYCVAHIGMDTKQLLYKRCKSPRTVLRRQLKVRRIAVNFHATNHQVTGSSGIPLCVAIQY
ncbi:uncharacterized protein LOC130817907 isoform X2 [Amaranthus tricolor]|uniref:uncharacterized protein LOC130817907 isoform X2 n=1 Tax=Amaranthus tricolor TaxID=29722 RepID=UPI002590C6D0|nr:uncharacterized protein LOC130817907 isoform X2 [Amaranthus tricolor]